MQFSTLFFSVFAALISASAAPTAVPAVDIISVAEFKNWLATTDAKLTFIGDPITDENIDRRAPLNTIVTYCDTRVDNVCGGTCTVYSGGATCLDAWGTNCLAATNNVAFCDQGGCGGSCNQLSSCGTPMDNGFCWTPGTNSIVVSPA
ncbi:hypothetical protein BDZ97DRAFT_1763135 [Flammula alnicola]|nr:hypothetical protein BDZ97DRAFT_1763135 [Flammula alnicola]